LHISVHPSHNIVDPFEDTESDVDAVHVVRKWLVTTSSIRSRILKADASGGLRVVTKRHNIVDPFEDTERSPYRAAWPSRLVRHNIVDPFEDTERTIDAVAVNAEYSHNIVDPFEDTESREIQRNYETSATSQHRRSVRGY